MDGSVGQWVRDVCMSHQSDWIYIYYKQPIKFLFLVSRGNLTLLFFYKGVNSNSTDESSSLNLTRCLLFLVTNGNLTLVFHMGVNSVRADGAKYCSFVFLCSPTPRKRLLHRLELTNHHNLFTWNFWKTKRDIAVLSFKYDGTLTLSVLMDWLCRDSFILCDSFTFHANFCNSILFFPSPTYATR